MPKISELTAGGTITGTELVPVVQDGATKRVTAGAITADAEAAAAAAQETADDAATAASSAAGTAAAAATTAGDAETAADAATAAAAAVAADLTTLEAEVALTIHSDGSITDLIAVTQAEYDLLDPPDATTLYAIRP